MRTLYSWELDDISGGFSNKPSNPNGADQMSYNLMDPASKLLFFPPHCNWVYAMNLQGCLSLTCDDVFIGTVCGQQDITCPGNNGFTNSAAFNGSKATGSIALMGPN